MGMASSSGFRESTEVPTGRLGIWWFLASEIVIFGGLICVYLLYRWRHGDWSAEAVNTINAAGAINTAVLLTSSLTMVLAHAAVESRDLKRAVRNLGFTLLGGCIFLVIKTIEYTHEIHEGFLPSRSLFWSFYYGLTGLHALHVIGGMIAILVVLLAARAGRDVQRIEYVGIYWHFVDLVWIFLFPLLYLAS